MGEDAGRGLVWVQDPATGETTGQITLTNGKVGGVAGGGSRPAAGAESDGRGRPAAGGVRDWDQDRVDAEFFALVGDLVGAPHEIVDPVSGQVVGRATQTLYGQRSWRGEQASPLLFAGQYYDEESGWACNRFRYYSPEAGVYNAQDPLRVSPRVASAQGYVDHAAYWIDYFGLQGCRTKINLGMPNTFDPNAQEPLQRYGGCRWRVGDHPMDPRKNGEWPSRSTENYRFWRNEGLYNADSYTPEKGFAEDTVERMKNGQPPRRFNKDKKEVFPETDGFESMEVSHEPIPRAEGGVDAKPRWPQDQARIDPQRHPGY
ncbi:RHS repeat domain-containing protein [Corynebacterium cystitidis]|uniref:RHS repeat domain-containing protein n=1 Tax=Corynebacterium cystitidis TaxID=35757 RepID=UPI00211DDF71|nr:RHS repeat-associated core domain-containing protein [Corynebacterium cystitidis]